jgi:hypothetical protein
VHLYDVNILVVPNLSFLLDCFVFVMVVMGFWWLLYVYYRIIFWKWIMIEVLVGAVCYFWK